MGKQSHWNLLRSRQMGQAPNPYGVIMPCTNWKEGTCTLGLCGGRPSHGVCAKCDKNTDRQWHLEQASATVHVTIARAARGAIAMAKTAIGISKVSEGVKSARIASCMACPHRTLTIKRKISCCGPETESTASNGIGYCQLCGCQIASKAESGSATCPDKPSRWAG